MPKTQLTEQADLSGGFNPTTDPLKTKPNEWIIASNVIISKPGGDANSNPTTLGSVVTRPLMRNPPPPPGGIYPIFSYASNALQQRCFVAKVDNYENWIFDPSNNNTIYYQKPISQGNTCIEIDNTGTNQPNVVLNTDVDISIAYEVSGWNLLLDVVATSTVSNLGTVNVIFTDSNGNTAEYSQIIANGINTSIQIPFNTSTGSFNPSEVVKVQIQIIPESGSPTTTLKISDLRFENSQATYPITCASDFGNGSTSITSSGGVITNLEGISVMAVVGDMLVIGTYPFSYWIKLKTGLTNVPILENVSSLSTDPINGTRVYFAEFPNPNNPQENIMGIMDGADVGFTYNPNAQPGYQFSNLVQIQNNVQTVVPSAFPASGTYYLTLNGTPIANALNWNDPSSTIQTALANLLGVGIGNVEVDGFLGSQSAGVPSGFTVTFGGTLSGFNPGTLAVETSPNPSTLEDINGNPITLAFSSVSGSVEDATPASGSYQYSYAGTLSSVLQWNATASDVETALNAMGPISAIGGVTVTGDLTPKFIIVFNNTAVIPTALTVVNSTVEDANGNLIFVGTNQVEVVTPAVNQIQQFVQWENGSQSAPTTYTNPAYWIYNSTNGVANLTPASGDAGLQSSLQAIAGVGAGNAIVTGFNGVSPLNNWQITFTGALAGTNPSILEMTNSSGMTDWKTGGGSELGVPTFEIIQTGVPAFTTTTVTTTFQISPTQSSVSVWRYLRTYKNMMILAGSNDLPLTIRPSQIDDYTDFDITGQNDVTLNGNPGERITGIYDMGQSLVITTNSHIWNLYGSNPDSTTGDFSLIPSESLVGCIEMGAGVRVGPAIYFYSGDDFYIYQGNQSVSLTNGKLKAILSLIPEIYKRAVTVEHDTQRNVLIWHIPSSLGLSGTDYNMLDIYFSLDRGVWGQCGTARVELLPSGDPPTYTIGVSFDGQAGQHYCGVDMTSDGSTIRPVFFLFGDLTYEVDPPSGTASNFNDSFTFLSAFNFCKSPHIIKDFMRCLITLKSVEGVDDPTGITLFFMSDGNPTDVRQVITGLQPRNGKIDVLLNGVAGESIAIGVQAPIGSADNSPIEISGYLVYWQAVEDL